MAISFISGKITSIEDKEDKNENRFLSLRVDGRIDNGEPRYTGSDYVSLFNVPEDLDVSDMEGSILQKLPVRSSTDEGSPYIDYTLDLSSADLELTDYVEEDALERDEVKQARKDQVGL